MERDELIVILIVSFLFGIAVGCLIIEKTSNNDFYNSLENVLDYCYELNNIKESINFWLKPSENYTMVTCVDNEVFIDGEKIEQPLDEWAMWDRTPSDYVNDVLEVSE